MGLEGDLCRLSRMFAVTHLRHLVGLLSMSHPVAGQVSFEQRETKHRVIVGREYYEPHGLEPEVVVERVFSFLLAKRVQRQTEGDCNLSGLNPASSEAWPLLMCGEISLASSATPASLLLQRLVC